MSYPIQFGFALPIFAAPGGRFFRTPNYPQLEPQRTFQLGVHADALGYDSLWVADHLMLGRDEAIMEGWTTLAALAIVRGYEDGCFGPSDTVLRAQIAALIARSRAVFGV